MKRMILLPALTLALALTMITPTLAERRPKGGEADPRIRTVVYRGDDVVYLKATYGVSLLITFGTDEVIDTITLGDTIAWQVVPNKKRTVVFIKPVSNNAQTNMNIITSKRIYTFDLTSSATTAKSERIYQVRFVYPDEAIDASLLEQAQENVKNPNLANLDVANINTDYGYKGAKSLTPGVIFDDGVKTFFKFKGSIPAIFAVDGKRNETLVNARRERDYIVVDGVNKQWTLRSGNISTCIFNLQFDRPDPDASVDVIAAPREIITSSIPPFGIPVPGDRPRLRPLVSSNDRANGAASAAANDATATLGAASQ